MNNEMNTAAGNEMVDVSKVHPWERAGLGKAPFRCVGTEVKACSGVPDKFGTIIGYAGQPAGTCDYCGQGIKYVANIRSADGKCFDVGFDCAERMDGPSNDESTRKMITKIEAAKRKLAAEKRAEGAAKRLASVTEALADESIRAKLAAQPHPRAFRNRETGEALTLLDWAEWMLANAGDKGRTAVAKAIKAV